MYRVILMSVCRGIAPGVVNHDRCAGDGFSWNGRPFRKNLQCVKMMFKASHYEKFTPREEDNQQKN